MSKVKVKFTRKVSANVKCRIYVNNSPLDFTNDIAVKNLEQGEDFELYWRMVGNPGSTLSIDCSVNGASKATANSTMPQDKTRLSDFTYISI